MSPLILYALVSVMLVESVRIALGVPFDPLLLAVVVMPAVFVVLVSSVVGGYVAGAVAGSLRARNGAIASLLGLSAVMALIFVIALFAPPTGSLIALGVAAAALFGALAASAFGRLGAMLAPRSLELAVGARPGSTRPLIRPDYRLLPTSGRKGGERVRDR